MFKLADISAFESLGCSACSDTTVFNSAPVLSRGIQNGLTCLIKSVGPVTAPIEPTDSPEFDPLWLCLSALLAAQEGVQLDSDRYSNDYADMKLMNLAPPVPMPKTDGSRIMGGVESFLRDSLDPQQAEIMMSMINYNVSRVMSQSYADLLQKQAVDWEKANGGYFLNVPQSERAPEEIIDFDNNSRWV